MRTCVIIQSTRHIPASYSRGLPDVEARILGYACDWGEEWAVDVSCETGTRILQAIRKITGVVASSFSFDGREKFARDGVYVDQIELSNRVIFVMFEPPRLMFRRMILHAGKVSTRRVITLRTWTDRMEDSSDD